MEVILLERIAKLGQMGDVVREVLTRRKESYAAQGLSQKRCCVSRCSGNWNRQSACVRPSAQLGKV